MNGSEFPAPGSGAGINAQIDVDRAKKVNLRNSRIFCWMTMGIGVSALIMAVCMLLFVITLLFPLSGLNADRGLSAFQWALGAFGLGSMGPWLWQMGRTMAGYHVLLDSRGAHFSLGTRKKPQELFLAWDQICAIKHKRAGNAQLYMVQGTDGSQASFTSYTFYRPRKVARLIAARTGIAIQEA
jgi:hypothetical protein